MKSDSRRIDKSTASAVTITSSANVTIAGIRFQSACAEKNVENRIEIAAASSALAVTGYCRAAFNSQAMRSASATTMPIATRTGG